MSNREPEVLITEDGNKVGLKFQSQYPHFRLRLSGRLLRLRCLMVADNLKWSAISISGRRPSLDNVVIVSNESGVAVNGGCALKFCSYLMPDLSCKYFRFPVSHFYFRSSAIIGQCRHSSSLFERGRKWGMGFGISLLSHT